MQRLLIWFQFPYPPWLGEGGFEGWWCHKASSLCAGVFPGGPLLNGSGRAQAYMEGCGWV